MRAAPPTTNPVAYRLRMRSTSAPRLLLYSHDTVGMGNIRRTLMIAGGLAEEFADASILLVSGSPVVNRMRLPPRVDTVKLPCLYRTAPDAYRARGLAQITAAVQQMRREMLTSVLKGFDPDLVVVDKRPFGVGGELLPGLEALRDRGRARIALGLRDVLDEPDRSRAALAREDGFTAIEHYYDEVWIYGSAAVFDATKEYAFPDSVIRRTRFCGYVCSPSVDSRSRGRKRRRERDAGRHRRRVLVTVGGGDDGELLVETWLAGVLREPPSRRPRTDIVLGPQMPETTRARLRGRARRLPEVRVRDFVPDMRALYAGADVVVSMAGYGTICDLLSHERRAVLVPRCEPVREQLIRARRFADLDRFGMVEPEALSPSRLTECVARELERTRCPEPVDLGGIGRVCERARALHSGTG